MKLQEFLSPKQKNRMVVEYKREFSHLSHYAGSLLTTSRNWCKRFEAGIKTNLRMQVVGFRHDNFSKLISQALKLERIESEEAPKKEKTKKKKSGKSVDQSSSGNTGKRKNFRGPSSKKSSRGRFLG